MPELKAAALDVMFTVAKAVVKHLKAVGLSNVSEEKKSKKRKLDTPESKLGGWQMSLIVIFLFFACFLTFLKISYFYEILIKAVFNCLQGNVLSI